MLKILCAAMAVLSITSLTASAQAQSAGVKMGIVNTETVIKELPDAKEASAQLEAMGMKIQDTLRMMQADFESKVEAFRKQEAMMSGDARKKEEESLKALQLRYAQYQQEKTAEVQRLREQFLAPIRDKVTAAIAAVAKEEKVTVVLDKVGGMVLFADDKLDLTFKVLDRLKRGEGK